MTHDTWKFKVASVAFARIGFPGSVEEKIVVEGARL